MSFVISKKKLIFKFEFQIKKYYYCISTSNSYGVVNGKLNSFFDILGFCSWILLKKLLLFSLVRPCFLQFSYWVKNSTISVWFSCAAKSNPSRYCSNLDPDLVISEESVLDCLPKWLGIFCVGGAPPTLTPFWLTSC